MIGVISRGIYDKAHRFGFTTTAALVAPCPITVLATQGLLLLAWELGRETGSIALLEKTVHCEEFGKNNSFGLKGKPPNT